MILTEILKSYPELKPTLVPFISPGLENRDSLMRLKPFLNPIIVLTSL